ncbi:MAG TPA: SHOCT domain-containing protein [Candidatus Krumholzibacteria bacterium]|nr:SHOCT domain-containing protein [Candidatus Krumholzibacteria bacterium]
MIGMWWTWAFILVLIGAGIWLVARVAAQSHTHSRAESKQKSPEEVLRDRFARGDIDENEYRSRMHALQHR